MSRRRRKKSSKPVTPKKLFFRIFCVTFLICAVVFTSGVGAFGAFMNSRPMDQGSGTVAATMQTEEKLDILVPGSGIFTADYSDSKRINILLYGNTDEHLADTIMLVSFDPETLVVDVISVPRDTYYERDGFSGGYLKINSVSHKGPLAMCNAINDVLLGIPINYYAMIEYDGVKNIVNALPQGGVPMNVERNMKYTSKRQNLYIDIKKGQQILDGDKAVQFLRYRKGYADGDMGRVNAQQAFIKSAAKEAIGPNLPEVAKTVVANVDSLITPKAMLYIAGKALNMDSENIKSHTLPGTPEKKQGLWFFTRSNDAEIEEMLRAIYEGRPYPPEPEDSNASDSAIEGNENSSN